MGGYPAYIGGRSGGGPVDPGPTVEVFRVYIAELEIVLSEAADTQERYQ